MFVCNMKVNSKSLAKIALIVMMVLALVMCGIGVYSIFFNGRETVGDEINGSGVKVISSSNFTNVLKTVHSNLESYVGTKIKFTGYIYRLYDFSDDQFVLAREMIVSSDYQGVVVGFLCHLNGANKYSDGCWVEVEGTITKGDYHGEIPVIEINKITQTAVPSEEYVYPPSEDYVATSNLI